MATNRETFDEIAESWYRLRHWCRFTTELNEMAQRWQKGRLLNVGCAHGPDFLPFRDNFELWGIDFSAQMITMAQKYAAKFRFQAHLVVADAVALPFSDDTFNWAIAVAAYHHIKGTEKRQTAFGELRRVLKPGAEAFITVWNKWQPGFWLKGKEVDIAWKSKGKIIQRYYYLYSYDELEKALTTAGFEVISMFPERYYSFPLKSFSRNICVMIKAV